MKESTAFVAGFQARRMGQLVLKRPQFPNGFQGRVFKDNIKDEHCRVHDQLMDFLLIP